MRLLTMLTLVALLAGCSVAEITATSGGSGDRVESSMDSPIASAEAPAEEAAAPVSRAAEVQPVSRSTPSPEAAAAIKACGADGIGLDRVSGMGELPSARLAGEYTDLWGIEPELQTDKPAWIIVFSGRVDLGRGYWADDPICVVIEGHSTMFAPHLAGRGDETSPPLDPPAKTTLTLPPLAP